MGQKSRDDKGSRASADGRRVDRPRRSLLEERDLSAGSRCGAPSAEFQAAYVGSSGRAAVAEAGLFYRAGSMPTPGTEELRSIGCWISGAVGDATPA
jgi:hypothetical protein